MKTYSRRKPGSLKNSDHDHDAVFSDVFKESAETEVSPSDTTGNKDSDSMGSRKRKNTNTKYKSRELKKLKKTKSEKVLKKKKLQKSKQTTIESTGVSISFTNDDPLFGDGPVMLDEGKKPRARRLKKASSLASKVSQKKDMEVSEACVPLHNKIPPVVQVGSKDKVNQWLASSQDAEPVPHDLLEPETSKEVFREIHETVDEKQHHLFPDDILRNLHVKPTLIGDTKALNAKRDNFMATFANLHKKSMEPTVYKHITPKTQSTQLASETQSPSQDNTITEMETTYTLGTETSTSVTGLMSTRTHVTETPSDIPTVHTDTQTSETVSWLEEKDTAQVSKAQKKYLCSTMRRSFSTENTDPFHAELSCVTESLVHKKLDEKTPKRYTNDFKVPGSPTKSATNKTQKKGDLQPKNSTQLFTSGFVEIVNVIPQMSTILMDENSRNSTALKKVVSSGVEDDDKVVMKTGKTKPSMKTSTPNKAILQEPLFQFDTDISSVTTSDNDDNDGLVFNQSSREVCSAEIIHLSTTRIEEIAENNDKIDVTKHNDEEKYSQDKAALQSPKQNCVNSNQCITKGRKLSAKKPDLYTVEQSAMNARHPLSLKVAREKNLSFKKNREAGKKMMHNKFHDMFGNPKRTLSFSSIHSTPSPRPGKLMFNSEVKHPPINKGNKPDKETADNSVFESEQHSDSKGRSVPVCPLMNDFSCPRKNLSLFVFKTDDTRSYDEILKTVPVDDLMLEIPTKGYGMKS